MYIDQYLNGAGFWFEEESHGLQSFIEDYTDHWVLGGVVTWIVKPLQTFLWNISVNIYDISDGIVDLGSREIQDTPGRWLASEIEVKYPGFAWLISDPVYALRQWFSQAVFPQMPITYDLYLWVIDCGEELFPGFRLFILNPADHLRRVFSGGVFPGMPVSDDWLTWLLDCGDELFPGFRLFVLDPLYQLKVMIAELFEARVDLFEYPGKWAIYWIRNALVDYREEYRGWLLPTLERVLRYFWEGVF